jgi:excisionase family DNA binding protein
VQRLALSQREAARLLGIDRGRTLRALIDAGRLRLVPWGSTQRIPLVDVQRVAEEGWTTSTGSPGRPRAAPTRARRGGRRARTARTAGSLSDAEVRAKLAEF